MIKTVIFDLDDTLYPEIEYCRSGFVAVAHHLCKNSGYPAENALFDAFWRQFQAGNYSYAFNAALSEFSLACSPELITELVGIYRGHVPTISLPAESKAILDQLKPEYTLALLTDGFLPAQEYKVRALGIEHYFKCIVYTEALGRQFWKPSPAGFEKILAACHGVPAEAVYVADNLSKDFIAPNKLGMQSIQLLRPDSVHKVDAPDESARAKYVIYSLSELPALLKRL